MPVMRRPETTIPELAPPSRHRRQKGPDGAGEDRAEPGRPHRPAHHHTNAAQTRILDRRRVQVSSRRIVVSPLRTKKQLQTPRTRRRRRAAGRDRYRARAGGSTFRSVLEEDAEQGQQRLAADPGSGCRTSRTRPALAPSPPAAPPTVPKLGRAPQHRIGNAVAWRPAMADQ